MKKKKFFITLAIIFGLFILIGIFSEPERKPETQTPSKIEEKIEPKGEQKFEKNPEKKPEPPITEQPRKITPDLLHQIELLMQQNKKFTRLSKKDRENSKYHELNIHSPSSTHIGAVVYMEKPKTKPDDINYWPPHLEIIINCEIDRNLGFKCLSKSDKDGLLLLNSVFQVLKITNPPLEKILNSLRTCIQKGCEQYPGIFLSSSSTKEPDYIMVYSVGMIASKPHWIKISIYENRKEDVEYLKLFNILPK